MNNSPFSELVAYIYAHPEKYAKYGRLLPKKEAMARLRREAAEMFGSGEEPVFEDGTSLHEILTEFLEKDIIVVFERDGELYPTRVTAIIDPILDKEIIEQIKRKSNRGVESHG